MKALSVKNPFAGLIVSGRKKYEVRSYKTKYRGPLAICSTKSRNYSELVQYSGEDDFEFRFRMWSAVEKYGVYEMPDGHILGLVNLVNVIPFTGGFVQERFSFVRLASAKELYPNRDLYLWVFSDAQTIKPIPIKGQLGIYNVPDFDY